MRLARPHIPYRVRLQVITRQLKAAGMAEGRGKGEKLTSAVPRLLLALFGGEPCHLDHNPALVNRPFNARTGRYTPDANDPDFLVYRTKMAHDVKTRIRGDGAQRSDLSQARYLKRVARNREKKSRAKKRGPIPALRNFPKWPSRPLRSGNRWPKRKVRS